MSLIEIAELDGTPHDINNLKIISCQVSRVVVYTRVNIQIRASDRLAMDYFLFNFLPSFYYRLYGIRAFRSTIDGGSLLTSFVIQDSLFRPSVSVVNRDEIEMSWQ